MAAVGRRGGPWPAGVAILFALAVLPAAPAWCEFGLTTVWGTQSFFDGEIEASDRFGRELAVGDFDGDGSLDLVMAVQQDVSGQANAGAVVVYKWAGRGSAAVGWQTWHQDSPGISGVAEEHDGFGLALAVGNFNGDAYDDLAIGVPYEDVGGVEDVGAVTVLYGSSGGLTATGSQLWLQGQDGLLNGQEFSDRFGFSLVAGNFDGDSWDDLAIGVPGDSVAGAPGAARGMVHLIYGSADGLTAVGDQILYEGQGDFEGSSEDGDLFGWVLASGNLDGDAFDDLIVATPWEDTITLDSFPDVLADVGNLHVYFGSSSGPGDADDLVIDRETTGVEGSAGASENFGWALAVGDVDGDGYDDVAVGIPDATVGFILNPIYGAGAVQLFYGGAAGLDLSRDVVFTQNAAPDESAETDDRFGSVLAMADFDGDGHDDVAVGVPTEDDGSSATSVGVINVFYGGQTFPSARAQTWHQGTGLGHRELCCFDQQSDQLGSALVGAELDGEPGEDLLLSIPGESVTLNSTTYSQAGVVYVLPGSTGLFWDGFEHGDLSSWQ